MNNQTKIANLNICGRLNNENFNVNVGVELNDSFYDMLLTEAAGNARRAAEFNAAQHDIELLKLKIEKMKLLKELRELENK